MRSVAETQPPDAILLTRNQAADRLQVSWKTIQRLTRAGELASVKIGALIRYRPEDLEAYAASRVRAAGGG